MDRKAVLLGNADGHTPILEIGPSYNPVAPRRDGWNATIVDHAPTDELRAKYAAMGVDTAKVEDVDFVWSGGLLEDAIPADRHGTFARLIASHVIEHIPDVLGFLRSAAVLLAPDGVLALAVPDPRFCFDYFKPPSTTGDILAAEGAVRHSRRTVFQMNAYSASADGATAFGQHKVSSTALSVPLDFAWAGSAAHSDAMDSPYVDAHAWHFTPARFRLAIIELADGGLIDWQVAEITPSVHCEFIVLLKRGRPVWSSGAERDEVRHRLLLETLAESHDQIAFAAAGGMIALPATAGTTQLGRAQDWAVGAAPAPEQPDLAGLHPLARRLHRLLSGGGNRWFGPRRSAAMPAPAEIGVVFPPYAPIVPRPAEWLDAGQAEIAAWPGATGLIEGPVEGWLRPADALALYEIAHLAQGDVLEMGSAQGLSTCIIGRALAARGRPGRVVSIEIDPGMQDAARATMAAEGLSALFEPVLGDATAIAAGYAESGRRFGAAFVDHDFRYPAARAALTALGRLLVPGGRALIHDFNDANNIAQSGLFGIYRAVSESVAAGELEFVGIVGCCAVLRKS